MSVADIAQYVAYLDAMQIQLWTPRSPQLFPALSASVIIEDEPTAPQDDATDTPPPQVPSTTEPSADEWTALQASVRACTVCAELQQRTQTVFGVGNRNADCMVIGEAPGADEDRQGVPFVGRAGRLLDEMLKAIGLARADVFIANILKCRPPGNRDPKKDEMHQCFNYLFKQIHLIKPKVILSVGGISAQNLLQSDTTVGRLRGLNRLPDLDIPVVVTYHPAYLLRTPSQKRAAWEDLKLLRNILTDVVDT